MTIVHERTTLGGASAEPYRTHAAYRERPLHEYCLLRSDYESTPLVVAGTHAAGPTAAAKNAASFKGPHLKGTVNAV